jgi:hypothetical protein
MTVSESACWDIENAWFGKQKEKQRVVYFMLKCLLFYSAEGGEGPEEGGQDHQRQPGEGLLEGVQAPTRLLNTRRELSRTNKVGFSHSSLREKFLQSLAAILCPCGDRRKREGLSF